MRLSKDASHRKEPLSSRPLLIANALGGSFCLLKVIVGSSEAVSKANMLTTEGQVLAF